MYHGYVTDYLHLHINNYSLFVFNFADALITLGAIIIVFTIVNNNEKELHKEIVLANPRGFCAGVDRAIDIVEKSLDKFKEPVYVRHQVVHNKKVVEDLEKKGVKFVKEVSEIPDNAVAIFSAHGVSQKVEDEAKKEISCILMPLVL